MKILVTVSIALGVVWQTIGLRQSAATPFCFGYERSIGKANAC